MEFQKNVIMDTLYEELKRIMVSLIVKIPSFIKKGETVESIRRGQEYLDAVDEFDNFRTYVFYEEEVLRNAGIPEELIAKYALDRNAIAEGYRDAVLKAKRKYIIENHEELNPYYRKYNGLPNTVADFLYLPREIYKQHNIPYKTPLHKIDSTMLRVLASEGIIEQFKQRYPNLEYLNFIGDKAISIYNLRKARDFQIIQSYTSFSDSINNDFNDFYLKAREYILHEVYDNAFAKDSEYYESFIGMTILFMAIQLTTAHYIKTGIKLDFYDKKTLNFIFNGYGIHFWEDIPAIYLRRLLRNLNSLLSHKGTNKVVVDICSLFGFDNIEIMSYFLLKDRRYDSNNMPVFETHMVMDENGELVEREDYDRMYDLKFVQVSNNTTNMLEDFEETSNHYEYESFIADDPYWNPDEDVPEFKQRIMEMEFNYVQTKYFSLKSVYDIIKMSFEVQYFFRMMLDLKPNIDSIQVPMGRINVTSNFKLFDIIVLLFALVCKRYKYNGTIITDPVSIANVLGFNFTANIDFINEVTESIVDRNLNRKDFNDYVPDFHPKTLVDTKDIVYNFFANKDIHDMLVRKRYYAETVEDYNAYEKLYRASMITEDNNTMYTKPNGEIAETYLDYLRNTEPSMWEYVERIEDDSSLNNAIEYVLTTLNDLFLSSGFEYLFQNLPGVGQDRLKVYIFDVIRIFKSFTVDLKSFNIYYVFDDKYMQNIKLLEKIFMDKHWIDNDRINEIIDTLLIDTDVAFEYNMLNSKDILALMQTYLNVSMDNLKTLREKVKFEKYKELLDKLYPEDLLKKMIAFLQIDENFHVRPYVYSLASLLRVIENITLRPDEKMEALFTMASALSSLLDILPEMTSDITWEGPTIKLHTETMMDSIVDIMMKLNLHEMIDFVKTNAHDDKMIIKQLTQFSVERRINHKLIMRVFKVATWVQKNIKESMSLRIAKVFSNVLETDDKAIIRELVDFCTERNIDIKILESFLVTSNTEQLMKENIILTLTKIFTVLWEMNEIQVLLDQLKLSKYWEIDENTFNMFITEELNMISNFSHKERLLMFEKPIMSSLLQPDEECLKEMIVEISQIVVNMIMVDNIKMKEFLTILNEYVKDEKLHIFEKLIFSKICNYGGDNLKKLMFEIIQYSQDSTIVDDIEIRNLINTINEYEIDNKTILSEKVISNRYANYSEEMNMLDGTDKNSDIYVNNNIIFRNELDLIVELVKKERVITFERLISDKISNYDDESFKDLIAKAFEISHLMVDENKLIWSTVIDIVFKYSMKTDINWIDRPSLSKLGINYKDIMILIDNPLKASDWKVDFNVFRVLLQEEIIGSGEFDKQSKIFLHEKSILDILYGFYDKDLEDITTEIDRVIKEYNLKEYWMSRDVINTLKKYNQYSKLLISDQISNRVSFHIDISMKTTHRILQNNYIDMNSLLENKEELIRYIKAEIIDSLNIRESHSLSTINEMLDTIDFDDIIRTAFGNVQYMLEKINLDLKAIKKKSISLEGMYKILHGISYLETYQDLNTLFEIRETLRNVSNFARIEDSSINITETLIIDRQ